MMRATLAVSLVLLCAQSAGNCEAVPSRSASQLVDAMRAARVSDGFEIRIALTTPSADAATEPTRIALIGQSDDEREHLLVKGITPARIHDRSIVAERVGVHVEATAFAPDATPVSTPADPMTGIFGTRLVVWDMLAPWWNWPEQVDEGPQMAAGHPCIQVRSRPGRRDASLIREALSCVDARNGLAWKTTLFDAHHHLLRIIEVTRSIRTQAGYSAVRSASITDGQGAVTLIEVYSGDEHYQIRPLTFEAPSSPTPARD